jgi:hypothetical protein
MLRGKKDVEQGSARIKVNRTLQLIKNQIKDQTFLQDFIDHSLS